MSTRERLTWGGDKNAARLPVENADRKASAHPATPDEGITHPAGYDDPTQPDAYENGDTSSWAEDVHPGPYENSAHPATPDEGPFHPAAKKAARELRAAVERKAAKCIRIATAMLGKGASMAEVEAQALNMMDLDDGYINSTLSRLAKKGEEEVEEEVEEEAEETAGKKAHNLTADDHLLRRLLAEEGMDEDEGDSEGSDKEASDRLAGIESALAAMQKQLQAMTPMGEDHEGMVPMAEDHMGMDPMMDEDEALLANLLAEEEGDAEGMDDDEALLAMMLEDEMGVEDDMVVEDDAEALLAEMMAEEMAMDEGMPVMASDESDEDAEEEVASDKEATLADYISDAEMSISLTAGDDPMGLAGEATSDSVLDSLYKSAAEEEASEEEASEEEAEEEEAEETAGKKASALKPRPKKASQGARTIGQPSFDKTASGEINDLERLWKSAPDVSDVF